LIVFEYQPTQEEPMSTLTQLKRIVAFYSSHHCEPQDFDECGGQAAFIDEVAGRIADEMPTADIEKIRPFLIDGNVNEWIVLGRIIDEVFNPAEDEDEDGGPGIDRVWEEHYYKFGNGRA
jgi:hypothetical protein